jgi:nucleoside-diphosphate-sugar epimerase
MSKILLVGGGGYVGNPIAYNFLKKNYEVSIIDNFIYEHKSTASNLLSFPNLRIFEEDIRNKLALEKIVKDYDAVIILAGLVGDPITKKYPELASQINDAGIKNIIDVVFNNKIKKLIFISTCSNYGLIPNDDLADEQYELNPISLYSKSKVNAENYIMSFKDKNTDTSATILRFATAFGLSNRMRFDLTVNHFVKDAEKEKKIVIYDADTWRPYCHLQDFSNIIEKVIFVNDKLVNFQTFNAGSNQNNYTKNMIVNEISKCFSNLEIKTVEGGNDKRNYRVNFNKIKNTLNFEPLFSIKDGINEIKDFFNKTSLSEDLSNFGNYTIKK